MRPEHNIKRMPLYVNEAETSKKPISEPEPQLSTKEVESLTSVSEPENKVNPPSKQETVAAQIHTEKSTTPNINIKTPAKRVSGLSISSLKAKKQHELNKIEVIIDEDALPNAAFTEETLRQHWTDFVNQIDAKGQKILASNLSVDSPKLKDDVIICIEMPNGTMKKEIERENYELMEYLRTKLNNHFIQLQITVNEKSAKKFAFTPEEKYQKLREKNPAIDVLRKEFDLDL